MKTMFCFAGCLWETHCRRTNSSDVVGSQKRAEQMQTINHIFKYSLFRKNTDICMLNLPILQSRLRSRHNSDIRCFCEYLLYLHTRDIFFNDVIKWRAVFCRYSIQHTWRNLYCTLHHFSFICKEFMVKALGWFTCMGCSPRDSKLWFSLKCSCVKKLWKYENNASNDGKPQITTAAPEVNYWPKDAKIGVL